MKVKEEKSDKAAESPHACEEKAFHTQMLVESL